MIEEAINYYSTLDDRYDTDFSCLYVTRNVVDDIVRKAMEYVNDETVIYYSTAMTFLMQEDTSLKESLEIADEQGYRLDNLNSETLATLLLQRRLCDRISELTPDIEDIVDDIKEQYDEEAVKLEDELAEIENQLDELDNES